MKKFIIILRFVKDYI